MSVSIAKCFYATEETFRDLARIIPPAPPETNPAAVLGIPLIIDEDMDPNAIDAVYSDGRRERIWPVVESASDGKAPDSQSSP